MSGLPQRASAVELLQGPSAADEADAVAEALAVAAGVVVRSLATPDEMTRASGLLADVWKTAKSRAQLDPGLLVALAHAGNYVAGAFRGDDLVAVCVGFFHEPAEAALHSHITGVVDGSIGAGIGKALKHHQRAWCLRHGATTMTWTYDPLVARNAFFNIHRLGGDATEYLTDFYGEMQDGLNRGQPSDRMLLVWDLVAAAPRPDREAPEVAALRSVDGRPHLEPVLDPGCTRCRVEVPEDIEGLRRSDPDLAIAWRLAVRSSLVGLLAAGWLITDFDRRGFYVLERNP